MIALVILLGVLLAVERWERLRLDARHRATIDRHAETLLAVVIGRPKEAPTAPAQVQAAPELEQLAEANALEARRADLAERIREEERRHGRELTEQEALEVAEELLGQVR